MKVIKVALLLASFTYAGELILRDRNKEMLDAAKDFGDAMGEIRRENYDRRRQAQLDSMDRVSDSLEAETKRIELELKRLKLQEARRKARADSIEAEKEGP